MSNCENKLCTHNTTITKLGESVHHNETTTINKLWPIARILHGFLRVPNERPASTGRASRPAKPANRPGQANQHIQPASQPAQPAQPAATNKARQRSQHVQPSQRNVHCRRQFSFIVTAYNHQRLFTVLFPTVHSFVIVLFSLLLLL